MASHGQLPSSRQQLHQILGKSSLSRAKPDLHPSAKAISWSQDWTYHHYTSGDPPSLPLFTTETQDSSKTTHETVNTSKQLAHITSNTWHSVPEISRSNAPPVEKQPICTHSQVHWPVNMISIVNKIIHTNLPAPAKPEFVFHLTRKAALRNLCVLMNRYHGDIGLAIANNQDSPLGYGSEFRPVSLLKPLLHIHPYWMKFKELLTEGSHWPLDIISEPDSQADVAEALAFGNHKEAVNNPSLLRSLITDDITQGFALPLPLESIDRIHGVLLAPMNIASQDTINEHGIVIPKK